MIIDNNLINKIKDELNKMYRSIGIRSQEFESNGFNIVNEGDKLLIDIPSPSTLKRNIGLIEKSKKIISKYLDNKNDYKFIGSGNGPYNTLLYSLEVNTKQGNRSKFMNLRKIAKTIRKQAEETGTKKQADFTLDL